MILHPCCRHHTRSGFTLVELMVVVVILGVLTTLALSSMGGLLDRSKQAECQSNLRQIGIAAMAYTADTGGLLPAQLDAQSTWHTELAPYIQSMDNGLRLFDFVDKRPPGVYACPSSEFTCRPGAYSDYGMNYFASKRHIYRTSPDPIPQRRPGAIPDASQVMWFSDVVNCLRELSIWSPNGNLDPRHTGESVNVLFVDGHVENVPLEEIMTNATWNQAPWGWQGLAWRDW